MSQRYCQPFEPSFANVDLREVLVGSTSIYGRANSETISTLVTGSSGLSSNTIRIFSADLSWISLLQETLSATGSIAFTLQTTITTLAQTAYYDEMAQFDAIPSINTTCLILAKAPVLANGLIPTVQRDYWRAGPIAFVVSQLCEAGLLYLPRPRSVRIESLILSNSQE